MMRKPAFVMEFLERLLQSDFMSHGHCYLWKPEIVWLHVGSDSVIALSYFAIPALLIYFARSKKDLPYPWIFWMFGAFILACGTTHVMEIWTVWNGTYRLTGAIKAITALISATTAVLLIPATPRLLALRTPGELELANRELESRVEELQRARAEIAALNEQLDDKAAKAQEDLTAILDSVADAVMVVDLEGCFIHVNPQAEALFGISRREVSGETLLSRLQSSEVVSELLSALEEPGIEHHFEFEEKAGERTRIYQARTSPLFGDTRQARGLVVVIREITRLRELDRLKSEFLSTAAHELRTPMTSIIGFGELLLTSKDLTAEQSKRYLHFIYDQSQQLAELVDDLLDVSIIEARKALPLDIEDLQIGDLLAAEVDLCRASNGRHSFFLGVAPDLPILKGDRARVNQVFRNLLSNATKYSPQGGRIEVRAWIEEHLIQVAIIDQGIGMTEQEISRAFERFYRADSSNTAVEGTGLGLAISKAIVEMHHGKITIESEPTRGTTVKVSFPFQNDATSDGLPDGSEGSSLSTGE